MISCSNCNSENVKRRGVIMHGKQKMARMVCDDCAASTYMPDETVVDIQNDIMIEDFSYIKPDNIVGQIQNYKKIVVSCAVMGHVVNETFLASLETYCKKNKAKLIIIPIKYKNGEAIQVVDSPAEKYYIQNNFEFGESFKIMGGLRLNASMEHPLAGLDSLSKGRSIVFAHPQVALKTVAADTKYPSIITSTGCITEKLYTNTKQGLKATFNHSHSAVVLEIDKKDYVHMRHLNFDGTGFYDLNYYYNPTESVKEDSTIDAIVTGDEHVIFKDDNVVGATYKNKDSIVNTLKPKIIIRHDVIDSYSISHHHKHNVFTQYAKYKEGYSSLQSELDLTIDFIDKTTPTFAENLIVSSNHHDHILRWLNECDPKLEPWNAELYHWFMYAMLRNTRMGNSGAEYPNPFELYTETKQLNKIKFISRNDKYTIHDVAINCHGDVGTNGSRGSRLQYSRLPVKHIIGHSHSPGITHGVYQVGTSSKLKLEYNNGPSSWHHCHCVIYKNGKRQLIFIQDGVWKA